MTPNGFSPIQSPFHDQHSKRKPSQEFNLHFLRTRNFYISSFTWLNLCYYIYDISLPTFRLNLIWGALANGSIRKDLARHWEWLWCCCWWIQLQRSQYKFHCSLHFIVTKQHSWLRILAGPYHRCQVKWPETHFLILMVLQYLCIHTWTGVYWFCRVFVNMTLKRIVECLLIYSSDLVIILWRAMACSCRKQLLIDKCAWYFIGILCK